MIKPGSATDIPAIMPVMIQAFDPQYGEAWNASQCHSALSMPGTSLIIDWENESKARGFAMVRSLMEEAELLLLAVHPNVRRQGLGNGLLDQISDDCRQKGVHLIFLEVRDSNPARRFYARCGFKEVGVRKNYYRGMGDRTADAITLRKSLD